MTDAMNTDMTVQRKTNQRLGLIPGKPTFNGQLQEDKPVKKAENEPSGRRKIKNTS